MGGPAECTQENFAVGLFLFSDAVILARKLMKNRKYRIQLVLQIDSNFEVSRSELKVTFKKGSDNFSVRFSDLGNACMWQQYANFCKDAASLPAEEDSPVDVETNL